MDIRERGSVNGKNSGGCIAVVQADECCLDCCPSLARVGNGINDGAGVKTVRDAVVIPFDCGYNQWCNYCSAEIGSY